MATWAIGDIQGCFDEFEALLRAVGFRPDRDRLWLVGDLVNRGPKSLEVLRFVRSLGDRAITVLGNHDLHLLAIAAGHGQLKRGDTLQAALDAPDRTGLLDWLRTRPLFHRDADLGVAMVHAALAPGWSIYEAAERAGEVEAALRQEPDDYFRHMYGDTPHRWDDGLSGAKRLRVITDYLTRVRFCQPDGTYDMRAKGPPGTQPAGLLPWYEVPRRASAGTPIVFGHWSAVGMADRADVYALDTGCVWGRRLSALCVEDRRWVSVECPDRGHYPALPLPGPLRQGRRCQQVSRRNR
jgi:bis(5'-nucleosyl)-tetraphosphatase (symmetrical)